VRPCTGSRRICAGTSISATTWTCHPKCHFRSPDVPQAERRRWCPCASTCASRSRAAVAVSGSDTNALVRHIVSLTALTAAQILLNPHNIRPERLELLYSLRPSRAPRLGHALIADSSWPMIVRSLKSVAGEWSKSVSQQLGEVEPTKRLTRSAMQYACGHPAGQVVACRVA